MTTEHLSAKLEALAKDATPGEWRADDDVKGWWGGECPACAVMFQSGPSSWSPVAHCQPASKTSFAAVANAALIVELRNALETIIAALRKDGK
jgi:hypothetical protein